MQLSPKTLISGRTTVTALLVVGALALGGGFLASYRAQAQGGDRVRGTSFGPAHLEPASENLGTGQTRVLIGMLLPAVQKVREAAARMQILNGDLEWTIPIPGAQRSRSDVRIEFFVTRGDASRLVLHVKNMETGEELTRATGSPDVTVRLLPAVQNNGRISEPLASSASLEGFLPAVQADGSVRPLPFHDALPPSIIAILIGL